MTRLKLAFLGSFLVLLAGCGGGDGGSQQAAVIEALVFKGALQSPPEVSLYVLRRSGEIGRMLDQQQTDNEGRVRFSVTGYQGPVALAVRGGSFAPFFGPTFSIPADQPMYGFGYLGDRRRAPAQLAFYDGPDGPVSITPVSHWLFALALAYARRPDLSFRSGLRYATVDLSRMLAIDPEYLIAEPAGDPASGPLVAGPQANLAFAVTGLCELAVNLNLGVVALMHLMGEDLADRKLDGLFFGEPLEDGGVTLPTNLWQAAYAGAILNFVQSAFNQSGLVEGDVTTIASLQGQAVDFPLEARITSALSPWIHRNRTSQIDVWGDWSGIGNLEWTVGRKDVDPADVVDNGSGGVTLTLGSTFVEEFFLADPSKPYSKPYASLSFLDTVTGYKASVRSALYLADPDAAPVADRISIASVSTVGGEILEIHGENLTPETEVLIGGSAAMHHGIATGRVIRVVVPQGPSGDATVQVRNGTQTVDAGTITRRAKDVLVATTPTDLNARYYFLPQFFHDPVDGFTVNLDVISIAWSNGDQGSGNVARIHSADLVNTPTRANIPVQAVRSRIGEEERFLAFASNYNSFGKFHVSDSVGAGLNAFAASLFFDQEPAQTAEDISGTYYLQLLAWDIGDSSLSAVYGRFEVDEDGRGSLSAITKERAIASDVTMPGSVGFSFGWQYQSGQEIQVTPDTDLGTNVQINALLSSKGVGAVYGTLDSTVIFGYLLESGRNESAQAIEGPWRGGSGSYRARDDGGTLKEQFRYGFKSTAIAPLAIGWFYGASDRDGTSQFEDDTEADFANSIRFRKSRIDFGGLSFSESDRLGAAYNSDLGFSMRMGGFNLGYKAKTGRYATIYAPHLGQATSANYQTIIERSAVTDAFTPNVESVDNWAGILKLDRAMPPVVNGDPFSLGITATFEPNSSRKTIDRDDTRGITNDVVVDPGAGAKLMLFGAYTQYAFLAYEGSDPDGYFGNVGADPTFVARGTLKPGGDAFGFSDSGNGSESLRILATYEFDNGATVTGTFPTIGVTRGYDAGNGDRYEIQWDVTYTFANDGTFSASGSGTRHNENGTTSNESFSETGNYTLDKGRLSALSMGGRTLAGYFTPDQQCFAALDQTNDTETTTFGGVLQATSAPDPCSQRLLHTAYQTVDDTVFPPRFQTTGAALELLLSAATQIKDVGFVFGFDNYSEGLSIVGQDFNVLGDSVGTDGAWTLNFAAKTKNGWLSQNGDWGVVEEDDPDIFSLGFTYRF